MITSAANSVLSDSNANSLRFRRNHKSQILTNSSKLFNSNSIHVLSTEIISNSPSAAIADEFTKHIEMAVHANICFEEANKTHSKSQYCNSTQYLADKKRHLMQLEDIGKILKILFF